MNSVKIHLILYTLIILFTTERTVAQAKNITNAYFEAAFSGNYVKAKQILTNLKKEYPYSQKTYLITANYYGNAYEISGGNDKYYLVCKKYADEAINSLIKKKDLNNEDVFRIISAKSILLKINVQKKNYLQVAKNMQSVIRHFEYAINHENDNDKMKFISGMYHYYAETAKEDYPIIYPLLLFYPSGDKDKGLKLLKECTHSGDKNISIRSLLQLALIYYRDEKKITVAENYFNALLKIYPNNLVWQTEYFKALKKYNKTKEYRIRQGIIEQKIKENSLLTEEQKNYFIKKTEL